MANIVDKAIGYVFPGWGFKRELARARLGVISTTSKYDAASTGPRGWQRHSTGSANSEIKAALPRVRAFSRDLKMNNPYAAKISDSLVFNVVGAGIVPGAKLYGKAGVRKQKLAQDLMRRWASSVGSDADGRNNLFGNQSLAFRAESDGGDALIIRKIVDDPDMEVPLQIRVLEGDFLDHTKNESRSDGTTIIQGIQFNAAGERTHYWIHESHPGESGSTRFNSKAVPAEDVIHLYDVKRPGQVRGMPRGVAGFMRLKNIDEFQDAQLALQKIAACFGAWIKTDGTGGKKAGDILPEKVEPGTITKLGFGEDVEFTSPPSASGQADFVRQELLAAAAPSGVTYQAATGDLRGVNFSSGKMGHIEFGRTIIHLQMNMVIPLMCKGIEKWFLQAAMLRGHDLSGVYFEWTPPRREMIDPPKEIPAILKALQGGMKSFADWARENNRDPAEWQQEIADGILFFQKLGIDVLGKKSGDSEELNNEKEVKE